MRAHEVRSWRLSRRVLISRLRILVSPEQKEKPVEGSSRVSGRSPHSRRRERPRVLFGSRGSGCPPCPDPAAPSAACQSPPSPSAATDGDGASHPGARHSRTGTAGPLVELRTRPNPRSRGRVVPGEERAQRGSPLSRRSGCRTPSPP